VNGKNISGATNSSLTITNASSSQSGNYTVIISSAVGTVTSSPANLVVGGAPELAVRMYPGITLKGTAGLKYRLDYEEAIGPTNNWAVLTNLVLATDQSIIVDFQATNSVKRLYRAILTP